MERFLTAILAVDAVGHDRDAAPRLRCRFAAWAAAFAMAFFATFVAWTDDDAAQAQTPVAIELVLAVDTSRSVDDSEFELQMKGIAWAFRAPEIIALIGRHRGVAVTLIQWSSEVDPRFVIPWHVLHEPATILAFADRVERAMREPSRSFTAMGSAIDFAIELIGNNAFAGSELKIDVSADGRNNTGPLPSTTWLRANALGITINGLPILIDTFNLDTYFRENVITGPGAFVEIATDYDVFARVFLRKLRRELTSFVVSRNGHAPDMPLFASRQSLR